MRPEDLDALTAGLPEARRDFIRKAFLEERADSYGRGYAAGLSERDDVDLPARDQAFLFAVAGLACLVVSSAIMVLG